MAGAPGPNHPLFHAVRLQDLGAIPTGLPVNFTFGFYCIGMLRNVGSGVTCGRRAYDFDRGVLFCMSPRQLVGHAVEAMRDAEGWLLFFDKSYLSGHSLVDDIDRYGFFDYLVDEALHLSPAEEERIEALFTNVHGEYAGGIDAHSHGVVLANLELLLKYTDRYYGRQFITRQEVEGSFVADFNRLLDGYFRQKDLRIDGIPSADHFAAQLHLSPKYLADKLRVLTGKTTLDHIHLRLIEEAKVLLLRDRATVAEVAYSMGFEYPQYFSRFFKKWVGQSPKAFRLAP